MGCQGRRGICGALVSALLLAALVVAPSAVANAIVVGDVSVGETNGTVNATFTITRDAAGFSQARTLTFQTVADTATSPADFSAASGQLAFGSTFLFGETQTQQVTVSVAGDALDEADETFKLVIAGPEVTDDEGIATIVDDDRAPSLSVDDSPAVAEGANGAHASFVVRLSAASGRSVSVNYATANVTAIAGQDYTVRSGTLVLSPGSRQAAIDVNIVDDTSVESAETFELRLSSAAAAGLTDGVASATIADDDEPPAPPPAAPAAPAAPGSAATSPGGGQQASPPALPIIATTAPPVGKPTTGSGQAALGVSSPRLRRPWSVLVTVSCPQASGRCSGRITIFSIPNRRSKIKALRAERRLGRITFAVAGGSSQTITLTLGPTDRALLRRTGRMRIRAYALTRDAAGRAGVISVNGTLIARTAHSSPSK